MAVSRVMSLESAFSRVVDRIYGVATNDATWGQVLSDVCAFVGARSADLNFYDPLIDQITRAEIAGFDSEIFYSKILTSYFEDTTRINPRMSYVYRMRESEIVSDREIWTPKQRAQLPFFSELIHPYLGIHESVSVHIRKPDDGRPWIGLFVHYHKGDKSSSDESRRCLGVLLPHLRRACETEEAFASIRCERAALAETLEFLPEPVALINASGCIVRSNRAADSLFRAGEGIALGPQARVIISSPAARDSFARALAECVRPTLLTPTSPCAPAQIVVPRIDDPSLVLTLQPLSEVQRDIRASVAVLFISDPASVPQNRLASLRAVFGLTPAEARLVQSLAEGCSLKQFAQERNLSYETARSYVRRALDKTGAKRQADLVGLFFRIR